MPRSTSTAALLSLFDQRVLLIDGAMGTCLQRLELTADDFGGSAREGCNEALLLTRPDLIAEIHARYFEAGADIVETNTFGATPLVLAEYGLAEQARKISHIGAQVARAAADRFSTTQRPRFVAGSMGPTTCALSIARTLGFEELVGHYTEQAIGLHEGGIDYFLVETCQDTLNLKAALVAIHRLFEQGFARIPIAVSATLEASGQMLAGQSAAALAHTLAPFDLLYVGLNCGAGVEGLAPHLSALALATKTRIGLMPNAGLPDETGGYAQSPESFAHAIEAICGQGALNLVGGCCGTSPEHIRALSNRLDRFTPHSAHHRPSIPSRASFLTGIDVVEIDDTTRPIIAGERSNALGYKAFRELISANDFEAAADFARRQLSEGAHLLDVAVQQADRDEAHDMERLFACLAPRTRSPLMIDSTNAQAVARALEHCQGKAIVNSANLEAGEARFLEMARVAKQFGAALVVGLIDESGMAIDVDRKLEIAARAIGLLEAIGFDRADLYVDALVFPCASADPAYLGAARETTKAIAEIKRQFPGIRTALGISNVSFGLPVEARAIVAAHFFQSCAQAGLDLAIANPARIHLDLSQGPAAIVEAATELLDIDRHDPDGFQTWKQRIVDLVALVREQSPATNKSAKIVESLTPEARITRCVAQGTKDWLIDALDAAIQQGAMPMALVNGPLMAGMDEVGQRFKAGERIVVEVLQSAEVMKAAMTHLESKLGADATSTRRGRLLLATVKGDVHDIGKNLVSMLFSSNGFEVIDLGIKVEDAAIVTAALEHQPDVIGLSGLLVKSALQMLDTARALDAAGVRCPLMVGGAALSQGFVDRRLQPAYAGSALYARDAMHGLTLAQKIVKTDDVEARHAMPCANESLDTNIEVASRGPTRVLCSAIEALSELPTPPDFERHLVELKPDEICKWLNPTMLYGHHLGLRGDFLSRIDAMTETDLDDKARSVRREIEAVQRLFEARGIRAKAVYRFVRAQRCGDKIRLDSGELDFPRFEVSSSDRCLADFVSTREDSIALFAVTAGQGVAALSEELCANGELLKSHLVQTLALAMAEAAAEWTHARIRSEWGLEPAISKPDATSRRAILAGNYRGGRFSPGYRACPDLKLQEPLFDLLEPSAIGISLTENWMMQPEASVSAFVFHHPQSGRRTGLKSL
ncbi:MAG: homocysteine S-methyltransferase family protein [Myxococcales bacterium]|jgi:5-methyltetrahydrofolate--homocysteine methyltransferase|nr:homocysteine S-methyltransferase family protein [Myxococcales bacterium]